MALCNLVTSIYYSHTSAVIILNVMGVLKMYILTGLKDILCVT